MTTALTTLTKTLAAKLDMGDGADLINTLKATAFKEQVTDAQMTALLVVANQYGLNPWVKEIYAFPDKQNGIVPVVGVDGWSRIINSHPQFDGIEFAQAEQMSEMPGAKPSPDWMECRIYRKDRNRPIVVREYLDEVYRPAFKNKYGNMVIGPWQTHTKRFLRHKVMIQCARLAFGFGGIYDQDEAERIVESQQQPKHMGVAEEVTPQTWPDEAWQATLPNLVAGIAQGKTIEAALQWASAKGQVTPKQELQLRQAVAQAKQPQEQPPQGIEDLAQLEQAMANAANLDDLYATAIHIDSVADEAARARLNQVLDQKARQLEQAA